MTGVIYANVARDQLKRLDADARKRIVDKVRFFAEQGDPRSFAKSLSRCDAYRFRVGDYRVICDIEPDVIIVLRIDKRDKVYKGL